MQTPTVNIGHVSPAACTAGRPSSLPSPQAMETKVVVEAEQLTQQLDTAVTSSSTLPELLQNLSGIIHEQTDCVALWFSLAGESGNCDTFRPVPDDSDNPAWPAVEDYVRILVPQAMELRQLCSTACESSSQLIAVPIRHQTAADGQPGAVWVGCFSVESQTNVRQRWLMGMIGQATTSWFQRRAQTSVESRARQLNDVLTTLSSLNKADSLSNAAIILANHLRRTLNASQVAVSLANSGDHLELTAVSDLERIDPSAESTTVVANANRACCEANGPLVYPPLPTDPEAESAPTIDLALQQYCVTQRVEACVNVPLKRADGTIGASLLIGTTTQQLQQEDTLRQYLSVAQMIGSHLDTVAKANRGSAQILLDEIHKARSAAWTRKILLATGILALVMCLPLPYRIGCDCTIQPVKRRYIAAPYDGILEDTKVKAGDVVTAGQILASMEAGNLHLEMTGVQAELAAARKRRDSALAQGEVAQSQIARSEMRRHQARIDLLNQQLEHLEIRSPIDGLVVNGDLEKAEGAPLEMGQTVFEVAPLDRMLAEIAIDESEIQYVSAGMPVTIKLNAFPFKTWTGIVRHIHPSTDIVKDHSVFIAEVELPNSDIQLKPGMEGSAKIRGNRGPLGWNLLHRPWESVRYWTVW